MGIYGQSQRLVKNKMRNGKPGDISPCFSVSRDFPPEQWPGLPYSGTVTPEDIHNDVCPSNYVTSYGWIYLLWWQSHRRTSITMYVLLFMSHLMDGYIFLGDSHTGRHP